MNNSPPKKNRRILVIDDNRAIHDDFRKILSPASGVGTGLDVTEEALFGRAKAAIQQSQFEVDSAYQGQEGVLLAKNALEAGKPYAMAFVDVRMPPGWDGVETTRKLWELDPDLQVVLCTAYSDYSWSEMIEKLGQCDGLLILKKPFDTVEAFQLAHALTEKWWLHQQSRRKMKELESRVAERTRELQEDIAERKQAEMALRSSEASMAAAQRIAHFGSWEMELTDHDNVDANRLRWSDEMFRIAGYEPGAVPVSNELFFRLVPTEDHKPIREAVAAAIREHRQYSIVHRLIRPDGEERIVREAAQIFFDEKTGVPLRIIGTAHDITESRHAENALRESSEKFQQLADNITDAFWIRSADMRKVHYVSPAFERIWGRSVESLYANPHEWTDFILPEDRQRVREAFDALTKNAAHLDIEYRIVRPDGAIRWVRVRGFQVRDAAGKLIRYIGIVTDITERQRAIEELRESERRFRDMLSNLELVSVMLDRDSQITYCNDYLLRVTGWRREEVIGGDWFKLFLPPERMDELRGVVSALLADHPGAWHHENEIVTRSGARRLIRWNNSVVRSASGEVIGTASIGEDITERKRLEAQLFQSQKLETVGKLAGGVAHEFNSILTAIIGQSELLLDDLPAGGPLTKNVVEISQAANRAATLTRQLLAYGRKQYLRPEILELNTVLAGMESTLRHLMGRGVEVGLIPGAGLKAVKADAGQLEQVIMNLAMNAADAMPKGGKLLLETANVTFEEQSVGRDSELKPGDYVMLAVTDTGSGMTDAVKARVFEPFFTTKRVGDGTGLGLSTCYGIIKQSGGHISVYSELARGTTFKIYLPQVEPAAKVPPLRLDAPDLPRGTETILLVEDDPALREMAATLLRRLGYTVLPAANGLEALSLKQQRDTGHIDLLFTDVVMPHMSGKELSDRVRAVSPHTRILFTSAYTENAIVHQGVLNPGVALLQKPFTPSGLARKVREVLDQPPTSNP